MAVRCAPTPTYRAAEWDISGDPRLTKPCGCVVDLTLRQSLDDHGGLCVFKNASSESLRAQVDRICKDGEFTHRYRRRWHTKEARVAYLALLELSDRLERDDEIGPYNLLTLEIMNTLAVLRRSDLQVGERCKGCGAQMAQSAEHGVYCLGCIDGLNHQRAYEQAVIAASFPSLKKTPERSYSITLEDTKYGARSREEMLIEIGAAATKLEKSAKLSPK